jgi:hypothetical protein
MSTIPSTLKEVSLPPTSSLEQRMFEICQRAGAEECKHQTAAKRNERISNILNLFVFVLMLLTSSTLFAALSPMFPNGIKLTGAVLGLLGAIGAVVQVLLKFQERASRHSELAKCFDVLATSCRVATDRFASHRLTKVQFDVMLGCYTDNLNQLLLRAHDLNPKDCPTPY